MSKPNILIITTHDSGRHFGCYGRQTVHTPRIDALAESGVQLDAHFAAVPICCASRASMMTGLYPQHHGLLDLCFAPFNWKLHDDVLHLSQHMRTAGYRTHLFGMQHEATDLERLAFDAHHASQAPEGGRATCTDVADSLAAFLKEHGKADKPLFAQVGFFETHTPFGFGGVEPDDSLGVDLPAHLDPTDTINQKEVAHLQGALRKVDKAVGVILDALDDAGLTDDTIVVFTTDHGLEVPRAKWHLYDPGIEIACIFRWPGGGLTGGRRVADLTSNVDFTPTILDLAGLDVPDGLDGVSLAARLRSDDAPPPRDAVFGYYQKKDSRCIRTSRYKLIRHFTHAVDNRKPVRFDQVMAVGVAKQVQLYDLLKDPVEFEDVSDDPAYAEVRAELDTRLWRWLEEMDDAILQGPLRTPAYESAIAAYQAWREQTAEATP